MDYLPESEQLTDTLFRKIAEYVYKHARINLTENKRELVRARLGKVIRVKGFKGYRDFYMFMESDTTGKALTEVLNALSTNLTSFFREPKHFDFVKNHMIPQIEARKSKEKKKEIRGWSAGCSTGEEGYSIAITILESIERSGMYDIKILGSDIDTNVVNCGAKGIYEKKRLETVPPLLLRKYFVPEGEPAEGLFRVSPQLSQMLVFRHLNLMGNWPFKRKFDFIFCRNVMIYFDNPTQEMLVNRFHDNLVPGGYLFIGHSEGLSGIKHNFRYVEPTIYQRK